MGCRLMQLYLSPIMIGVIREATNIIKDIEMGYLQSRSSADIRETTNKIKDIEMGTSKNSNAQKRTIIYSSLQTG